MVLQRLVSCFFLLMFFLLVGLNVWGQKQEPVTIDVVPRVFACTEWEKFQVRVLIRVEPNDANRYLQFAYSSPTGISGSSLQELDGQKAALAYTRYVNVDCHYYLFSACVLRTQGKKFCAKQEVQPP